MLLAPLSARALAVNVIGLVVVVMPTRERWRTEVVCDAGEIEIELLWQDNYRAPQKAAKSGPLPLPRSLPSLVPLPMSLSLPMSPSLPLLLPLPLPLPLPLSLLLHLPLSHCHSVSATQSLPLSCVNQV